MTTQNYILGQGKVYLDTINATTKLPMGKSRWIGNVPNGGLTFSFNTEQYEHQESYTGNRLTDKVVELGKMLEGTLRIEDLNKDNLAVFLYGTGTTVAGATITDEAKKAYPGYSFALDHINLTSFTSLEPAPTGTAYVAGTDYTVDLKAGRVHIVSGGAITAADGTNVLATYVAGAYDRTVAFSTNNTEYWLRFDGVNNADNDKPVVCEVFKTRFALPSNFDLFSTEIISLEMAFKGLYESTLDGVTAYDGGFFRIMKPAAV